MADLRDRAIASLANAINARGSKPSVMRDHLAVAVESIKLEGAAEAEQRLEVTLKMLRAQRDELILEQREAAASIGELTQANLRLHDQLGRLLQAVKLQGVGMFAEAEKIIGELEAERDG